MKNSIMFVYIFLLSSIGFAQVTRVNCSEVPENQINSIVAEAENLVRSSPGMRISAAVEKVAAARAPQYLRAADRSYSLRYNEVEKTLEIVFQSVSTVSTAPTLLHQVPETAPTEGIFYEGTNGNLLISVSTLKNGLQSLQVPTLFVKQRDVDSSLRMLALACVLVE